MEVKINQVVLHLLDPGASEPVLSDRAMDMEYYTATLERAFASDEVKNCRFLPDSAFAAEMAQNQDFIDLSRRIAGVIFEQMLQYQAIPAGDLAVVDFTADGVPFYGVLKLNYRPGYTHHTELMGNGRFSSMVPQRTLLPGTPKADEAALIDRANGTVRLIEKKFTLDDRKDFYLSTRVFGCTEALQEKAKLKAVCETAVAAVKEAYPEPEELDAFCKLFGELDAPLGKYYVLGNHDLFHHWREPSFGRADLERGFAAAGVRILEDTSVLLPCGVRVVGRKDYLYTNGSRFTAAQLMPGGPDDHYTVWLDHEPRDFKNAAAAGADLILSGHTHGGQVWPAGAVGMVAKNERNYGRKHIADHCDAIVSGGTGTWGYKFRTQGRTEIVCAEITTEREN